MVVSFRAGHRAFGKVASSPTGHLKGHSPKKRRAYTHSIAVIFPLCCLCAFPHAIIPPQGKGGRALDKGKEITLLIIDDDASLVAALCVYFSKLGYAVLCASDGLIGLQQLYNHHPDMVLLDIMMPNMDGWETCRRIRELSDVPIIMLTARDQEVDKVMGLRLGADDYISKPFGMKELAARFEALLRRAKMERRADEPVLFADENLVIDARRWEVRRDGQLLNLTSTELRFLFFLVQNANHVLTHEQILAHVWGAEYASETDYTKLFVWRLRQKLEPDSEHPRYILTERGIGYRFCTKP